MTSSSKPSSSRKEHLYLLFGHDGWEAVACGPNEEWSEAWNRIALPRLKELSGSPYIGNRSICREPEGRAGILEACFGINPQDEDPSAPDPFYAAYPRVRVTFSDDESILLEMGFDPREHRGIERCLGEFLDTTEWRYRHDPSLCCDKLSKEAMGGLTGLGFRSDWPVVDNGERGDEIG